MISIRINIFKDILSEEYETLEYRRKVGLGELFRRGVLNRDARYLIIVNDEEYIYPEGVKRLGFHDGDIVNIRLIPEGQMPNWATYTLGVMALVSGVAFAIHSGGASIAGAFAILSGVSTALGGASMIALQAIEDATPQPKTAVENGKTYGFGGAKNKVALGSPFPVVFGTHRITPSIVGQPYTSLTNYADPVKSGGKLTCLLCLGYGKIKPSNIRLGDNVIAAGGITDGNIPVTADTVKGKLEVRYGALPDLYHYRFSYEAINSELTNEVAQGGEIAYVERVVPFGAHRVEIKINFNGLFYYNADRTRYDIGEVVVTAEVYENGVFYNKFNKTFRAKSPDVLRFAWTILFNSKNKNYRIKLYASSNTYNNAPSDGSRSQRVPILDSLTFAFNDAPPVVPEIASKMTFLAYEITANANTNGTIDALNCDASTLVPVYSGTGSGPASWAAEAYTSNPAAIALNALRGGYLAKAAGDDLIDWPAFETLYNWCKNNGYECNAIITESKPLLDILNDILSTCQAAFIIKSGKYSVAHDATNPYPLAILSPKNTRDFSMNVNAEDKPVAVEVSYLDENNGYQSRSDRITLAGNEEAEGETVPVEPFGITSYDMAVKYGRYLLACREYRGETITVKVPFYHAYLPIGSRVLVQQDIILEGVCSGQIVSVDPANKIINIDEDLTGLDASKTYSVSIVEDLGNIVPVNVEILQGRALKASGDVSGGWIGKTYALYESGKKIMDCVIKSKSGISMPEMNAAVELILYNENIFKAITEPVPPYIPNITYQGKPVSDQVYVEPPKYTTADNAIQTLPDGSVIIGGEELGAVTDVTPPDPVAEIVALAYSNGSVIVSWPATEDNVGGSGLSSYQIYRALKEDKSDRAVIASTDKDTLSFTDNAAVLNTPAYYGVSASDRRSNISAVTWAASPVTAKNATPPGVPSNLKAKAIKGRVELRWETPSNAGEITNYQVWKKAGLADGTDWELLGLVGTPSYNEEIGKIEASVIKDWRYKVRAYNLYETAGDFSNVAAPDVSDYGTYIKEPVTPQLSAVNDSIVISWAKQYDLMDYEAMQVQVSKDGTNWGSLDSFSNGAGLVTDPAFTEITAFYTHSALTLDTLRNDETGKDVPQPTTYYYRMRQVDEDKEGLAWSAVNTPVASTQAEPLDFLKLNVGNLSVTSGNFVSMKGGQILGFAKDDRLPAAQRISSDDSTLSYWDLTNGKFRIGTLESYFFVDYVKSLVEFRGTSLQLNQSDLTTNASGVHLKHAGNALTWGSKGFNSIYSSISGSAKGLSISSNVAIGRSATDYKLSVHGDMTIKGNVLFVNENFGTVANLSIRSNGGLVSYSPLQIASLGVATAPDSAYALKVGGNSYLSGDTRLGRLIMLSHGGEGGELALETAASSNIGAIYIDSLGDSLRFFSRTKAGSLTMTWLDFYAKSFYTDCRMGIMTQPDSAHALNVGGSTRIDGPLTVTGDVSIMDRSVLGSINPTPVITGGEQLTAYEAAARLGLSGIPAYPIPFLGSSGTLGNAASEIVWFGLAPFAAIGAYIGLFKSSGGVCGGWDVFYPNAKKVITYNIYKRG